jgi:uncharacterized membrane protein YeaQ/YmgE (transglycosylase-associated protein family)
MGVVAWIILGLIVGSVAQSVTGIERRGCLFTMLIGVVGALLGGLLFNTVSDSKHVMKFNLGSMFVAFIGAGVVCLGLKAVGAGGRSRSRRLR